MATNPSDPRFRLGDTVCFLPTGWHYVICGAEAGTYALESLNDAPNVFRWVDAQDLRLVSR